LAAQSVSAQPLVALGEAGPDLSTEGAL